MRKFDSFVTAVTRYTFETLCDSLNHKELLKELYSIGCCYCFGYVLCAPLTEISSVWRNQKNIFGTVIPRLTSDPANEFFD